VAVAWGVPLAITGFCQAVVLTVCLRLGTYYYVHQMLAWGQLYELKSDPDGHNSAVKMSIGFNVTDISFGALNDPLEETWGYRKVDITTLDCIAAIFPFLFVVLAIYMDELSTWTRIMLCHSLLALGKGAFAVLTVVPDSSGWSNCKARLGDKGVEWLSQPRSVWELITLEIKRYFGGLSIRFCADMMYSGHTFFTTLYALGLFELVRIGVRHRRKPERYLAYFLLFLVAGGEQLVEAVMVLLNRFHYTMDVVMAIALTFLFYTNGAVATASKWWIRKLQKQDSSSFDEDCYALLKVKFSTLEADGEVIVPPCCLPFCCVASQQHIYGDDDIVEFFSPHAVQKLDISDNVRHMLGYQKHDKYENICLVLDSMNINLDDFPSQAYEAFAALPDSGGDV